MALYKFCFIIIIIIIVNWNHISERFPVESTPIFDLIVPDRHRDDRRHTAQSGPRFSWTVLGSDDVISGEVGRAVDGDVEDIAPSEPRRSNGRVRHGQSSPRGRRSTRQFSAVRRRRQLLH